jgi:adenylate kinase
MSREIFVLLGAPCSGKGTQCFLLKNFISCVSAGDMLRNKYPEGTEQRKRLDKGEIIEPDIVNNAVADFINSNKKSVLIDGYPRSDGQAAFISGLARRSDMQLTAIILETKDFDCLRQRMKKRTFCKTCQRTYIGSAICCEAKTVRRRDDNDEIFEKRLQWYVSTIDGIIGSVNSIFIDATKPIDEIHKLIRDMVS